MVGNLLEPKSDPRFEPEPWIDPEVDPDIAVCVDPELEAEDQRIREEQAQAEREYQAFMAEQEAIERQLAAEEEASDKEWSKTLAVVSGELALAGAAAAVIPGCQPAAVPLEVLAGLTAIGSALLQ